MYFANRRLRKAGVAALAAATALSATFAMAPAAGALPATNTDLTLVSSALRDPLVGQGKSAQTAGPLQVVVDEGDTLTAGDQILLTVDDEGAVDCTAGDTVAFSALPTVTVAGTATIVSTLEASDVGCGNDTLRLNVTGGGSASISITGISYNVGTGADVGSVTIAASLNGVGNPIDNSGDTNAFVTTVLLSANNPPKGAATFIGGSYTISPIVLTEQVAAAADDDICIGFSMGTTIEGTPLTQPTVAVTGGTDTATVTADAGTNTVLLDVTAAADSASTFTVSGVVLATDAAGVQSVGLHLEGGDGSCATLGDAITHFQTTAGYVGDVTRFGGADRFATAQILFEETFGCRSNAIIARGDLFPDALAASYLAGHANTGILLTNTNSIPASTLNALRNEGVRNVYLMGGTTAISGAVEAQLDGTQAYSCGGIPVPADPGPDTLTVQRIGGATRFETAQMVAEFPGLDAGGSLLLTEDAVAPGRTAILASGLNFPDALAAGPLAFRGAGKSDPVPLLLTNQDSVPAVTLAALTNLGISNVIVAGGTSAVSDAAVAQLTSAGYSVRRIAGANRQATATALADALINEWFFSPLAVSVARGDNFADVLPGGPSAGAGDQVILLTGSPTNLSTDTGSFLSSWVATFDFELGAFEILGGTSAIPSAVVQAALDAASQQ
jgi:putative cell wall-binding protein